MMESLDQSTVKNSIITITVAVDLVLKKQKWHIYRLQV
jgi:hypothetical protein